MREKQFSTDAGLQIGANRRRAPKVCVDRETGGECRESPAVIAKRVALRPMVHDSEGCIPQGGIDDVYVGVGGTVVKARKRESAIEQPGNVRLACSTKGRSLSGVCGTRQSHRVQIGAEIPAVGEDGCRASVRNRHLSTLLLPGLRLWNLLNTS